MWWHTIKEREQDVKKDELLKLCFFRLVKLGLENTTMRDFSDATNMNASNLYYWFKDKDTIIQGAAEWGLINCTKLIFDCAYKHIGNLDELCQQLPDMAWEQRFELRFIFQIATSPYYGEHMNKLLSNISEAYEKYANALADKMQVSSDELYPFVNLAGAAVAHAIILDNYDRLKQGIKCIVKSILNLKMNK